VSGGGCLWVQMSSPGAARSALGQNHLQRVIVVVGSTGVGKSKLGVEVAAALGGEVVNADAMHVYRGLDVTTNKTLPSQMGGVRHHVMDVVDAGEENFSVVQWRALADAAVRDIAARGRVPVVVGGTGYYVTSLLERRATEGEGGAPDGGGDDAGWAWIAGLGPAEAHARLQEADPDMAAKLHPNDGRKVRRALESVLRHGVKLSDAYRARVLAPPGAADAGPGRPAALAFAPPEMRYRPLVLWVHCAPETLDGALEARVGAMLGDGLEAEVRALDAQHGSREFTRGLLQSIGVREFLGDGRASTATGEAAANALVGHHKRLARRQVKFLGQLGGPRHPWPVHRLDATRPHALALAERHGLSRPLGGDGVDGGEAGAGQVAESVQAAWNRDVRDPAVALARRFVAGEDVVVPEGEGEGVRGPDARAWASLFTVHTCEACGGRTFRGDGEWAAHTHSRKHKKRAAAAARRNAKRPRV